MSRKTKILVQTTIPPVEDDWHVGRFSLIARHLRSLVDDRGEALYEVVARDRETTGVDDPLLSELDTSDFDELWLFAVDTGDGLTANDCAGITRFRKRGGGILTARDHQDLGSSICTVGGLGEANYFHSKHPDPDESRRIRDDQVTRSIDYPNYHSGANGDYQVIASVEPFHPILLDEDGNPLKHFPAHPHEGGIGAPAENPFARVIATGTSKATGRDFNIAVVFERGSDTSDDQLGRGVVESTFHHFADYNWDPRLGCPSFVEEAPADGYEREPEKLNEIKRYVENVARWLTPA